MSVVVHAPADTQDGVKHDTEAQAITWLESFGYVPREGQRGQWVRLLPTGNQFASITRTDSTVWERRG